MSQQDEKDIFNYLDQECDPEQKQRIEARLASDPQFRAQFQALESVHNSMSGLPLEKAPTHLSSKIMADVKSMPLQSYHFGDNLLTGKGFFLVTGILTALVAMVSLFGTGYVSLEGMDATAEGYKLVEEWSFVKSLFSRKMLTTSMLVIYGILSLAILDRIVLRPLFRKKLKQVTL